MVYNSKPFGGHVQVLNVNPNSYYTIPHTYLQELPQKIPLQSGPTLSILITCKLGVHADFSSIENIMSYSLKLRSRKPTAGARDNLNQQEFKDSQEP